MTDQTIAALRPKPWQQATIVSIRPETSTAKTFRLALDEPAEYLAGQHYVLRLTAPDGYTASRSYSVASAPDGTNEFELTIEHLPGGEVSSFLYDGAEPGDELEVRGPIGGWFVWPGDTPALLVAGGSGIVPLMAMVRLARRLGHPDLVQLVVSVRNPEQLYFSDEVSGPQTTILYTREIPEGWSRPPGRLTTNDLPSSVPGSATAFVCGSAGFADAATDALLGAGVSSERIRVERFGPTS